MSARPTVFAVEPTAAQLTWPSLPAGTTTVTARASVATVEGNGGPAATALEGLPPAAATEVLVQGPGGTATVAVATPPPPPGRELARLATVSDCHLGSKGFGQLPRYPTPPGAVRACLEAAVAEAVRWGAQLVVCKGDLTQDSSPAEWGEGADVLGAAGVPVLVVPGNHDRLGDDALAVRTLGGAGIPLVVGGAGHHDLPGLRVVAADVTVPWHHGGRAAPVRDEVASLVAGAPGAALVAVHQQPQRFRRTTHWPPGLAGPDADAFLAAVAAANPATLVTNGHTHRHRRRRHGPLVLTEVGSTSDYPGTWAGYVVHEGGITQTVRRVAAPAALRWTESTRGAYLGSWGPWAAWRRDARCFSHAWPAR